MTRPNIEMTVRKPTTDTSVIDIRGEINSFAEQALMQAYNEASANGIRNILLNFSNLEYMNSSGIGLLVTLLIRASRQKQNLMAYGLNDHYRQIFELTRLNEAVHLYGSEAEAIAAVGAGSGVK
jgi:anti-sigma B factor antagonist